MNIFKEELNKKDIDALKEEHAQKESKVKLDKAIAERKAQMDLHNKKVMQKKERTCDSKHYIF